jgi:zinc D-Ala-D-Ala carboxypeptidase
MQNKKRAFLFCAVSAVIIVSVIAVRPAYYQQTTNANERLDTTRPRTVLTASTTDVPRRIDALAPAQNARLMRELNWTFVGRPQRGWHLYAPLVRRLIGTEQEAGTNSFAEALARWQQTRGLMPTGVLDSETLERMIETWQSRRSPDRTPPPAERLITAPPSDFYHPTRPAELRQVEREAYAAFRRMVAAAVADPSSGLTQTRTGQLAPQERYLRIISSYRTREYQEQLRRQSPNSSRAGLAVNSPHFTGRALDIYVGGDPVDTSDYNRVIQVRTQIYQWLVRNAERFGFHPYFYEPWHWEYRPPQPPQLPLISAEETALPPPPPQ